MIPRGLSPAAFLTALSLRAGLPGDAWRWMNLDAWQRATGRAIWH